MTVDDLTPTCPADRLSPDFDHHGPELAGDPFGCFRAMREQEPVFHSTRYGGYWLVSRYEDVVRVAQDDATFCSADGVVIPGRTGNLPIESDPPEFFRYRRLLNPLFSPKSVDRWRPLIVEIAESLIDDFAAVGSCDLNDQFARPLPVLVTLRMLGMPTADWRELTTFTLTFNPDAESSESAYTRHAPIHDVIVPTIAARRRQLGDDVVSDLIRASDAGVGLTDHELFLMVRILINGGLTTTMDALTNILFQLGKDAVLRRAARADIEVLRQAVEESLRFEAPVTSHARTVTRDTVLGGRQLHKGDKVLMLWSSGNRDDAMFGDPDTFQADRFPNRHLAFGVGIHRCVGSNLARLEIVTAVDALLQRIPDYTIDVDAVETPEDVGVNFGRRVLPATFQVHGR